MRGNVIDMAVGVIVGGAFGKIVTSLVNDIIMPGVGVITGGANFSEFKYVLQPEQVDGVTKEVITPEVAITWGAFVQTVVDFLIIAFCIFLAIKVMNKLMRKRKWRKNLLRLPQNLLRKKFSLPKYAIFWKQQTGKN